MMDMTPDNNCGNCAFWENRPEMQMDVNTGFCAMKDVFKQRTSKCNRWCKKGRGEVSALIDNGMYLPSEPEEPDVFELDA
jgi:hypothetical protein